jgi:hypothetical protein
MFYKFVGSPMVLSCFQEIVDSLKLLPDDDLKDVARLLMYIIALIC